MATGAKPEEADPTTINGVEVTREEAAAALGGIIRDALLTVEPDPVEALVPLKAKPATEYTRTSYREYVGPFTETLVVDYYDALGSVLCSEQFFSELLGTSGFTLKE